jgi:hypothetical protein
MFALQNEAQSRNAFAQALAAFARFQRSQSSQRRWYDERERQQFFAEFEARRALSNVGLASERRRNF